MTALLAPLRHLGIFLGLGIATLLLGVTVHHLSSLPREYTWWAALTTIRNIVAMPHIPLIALFVYGIGRYAHRGAWDPYSIGKRLTSQFNLDSARKRALLVHFAAGLGAATLGIFLFPKHTPVDVVAMGLLGSQLPSAFRTPRALAEFALQAAVAIFVFSVLCYTFTVIKALLFVGNQPLDARLIDFESSIFGEPLHRKVAAWAGQYPSVVGWCDWIYNRFFHHMILTSVLLFALRRAREQNEYLAALLFCYLAGAPLYHLLPAAGPVYFEPEYYEHVRAQPELVTNFLHHWLFRQTTLVTQGEAHALLTWTYVAAMPSLHVAHEVVMTWYSRRSRIAFALSATFTLSTVVSIMVLGWHYFIDAIAGATLAAVAIAIARKLPNAFMPSFVRVPEDVAIPEPRAVLRPFWDGLKEGLASQKRVPVID